VRQMFCVIAVWGSLKTGLVSSVGLLGSLAAHGFPWGFPSPGFPAGHSWRAKSAKRT